MAYSTIQDVLKATGIGISVQRIVTLHEGGMTEAQINTMIEEMIAEADEEIKEYLNVPIIVRKELHVADGETSEFLLGPSDEEHYVYESVENCLEDVVHCYFDGICEVNRRLHPYPTDCDDLITENQHSLFSETSNATVTSDDTTKRAGSYSTKIIFSDSGYARAVLAKEITIDQYEYAAFLFRTNSTTPTFTLYLYDKDGNSTTQTFTINKANQWYIIWIRLDNMSGNIDWETLKLYKIGIYSNGACIVYVDNFNFNDSYCWEAPTGYLYINEASNAGEEPPVKGQLFYVTYRYDPYKVSTPALIRKASKYFAGASLIEHLIGLRQAQTGFMAQGSSGERIPDREALNYTSMRLRKMGEDALNKIGFGWEFDPIKG